MVKVFLWKSWKKYYAKSNESVCVFCREGRYVSVASRGELDLFVVVAT